MDTTSSVLISEPHLVWGLYRFLLVDTTISTMSKMSTTMGSLCSFGFVWILALLPDGTHIIWSGLPWPACFVLHLLSTYKALCYGLQVCVPTKFTGWNSLLQCDSIWRYHLWEIIMIRLCHGCGAFMIKLMSLWKEEETEDLAIHVAWRKVMWRHNQVEVTHKEPNHASTLISECTDFSIPNCEGCLFFKLPSL